MGRYSMGSEASETAMRRPGCVFFVTRKWAPAMGGMETYAMRLSEELARRTATEIVFLAGRDGGLPPSAAALLRFPFTVLRRFLRRRRDIAVIHLADMALWPLGMMAWLASPAPRVVLSAHGTDVAYPRRKTPRGRLYGAYLRLGALLLPRATVIANSHATRQVTREAGWRRIEVIPLATDIAAPSPGPEHDGSLLFAGRLVERKGCAWFIRNVLPLLPDGARLRVAGTVWDKAEAAALETEGVEFLGNLSGQALIDAYRSAMCVVVPNIEPKSGEFEGFGLVAVEAAAAGGVVLAAACGGLTDAVIDGETGILVPAGDAEAWRRKIANIQGLWPEQRRALIDRAVKTVAEYYNWPRVARETFKAYKFTDKWAEWK